MVVLFHYLYYGSIIIIPCQVLCKKLICGHLIIIVIKYRKRIIEEYKMTLGKKIKHYRNALNITQEQLAKLIKVHTVTIKKYETDALVPLPKQLEKLADVFDVSIEELLYQNSNTNLVTKGDLYSFVLSMLRNNILIIIPSSTETVNNIRIIVNPVFKNYFDVKIGNEQQDTSGITILINNDQFKTKIVKWYTLYTDIEILKSEHYDILKKKGNCLTKEENDIVFKIENLEVELEKFEIDLINNKEFLERNPQI